MLIYMLVCCTLASISYSDGKTEKKKGITLASRDVFVSV